MSLIVIVDDRNTNRNIFAKLAASIEPDITVRTFGDPGEALVWLADHAPDLVITDYKMPGMDGAEFIRLFRQLPAAGDIPVIVITVYEERTFRLRALEAGATDFLNSPVDHHEFVTRARNLLKLQKHQKLLAARASTLAEELENSERSRQRELRHSSARLAQVIDTLPIMINATSPEGEVMFANSFQTTFFGRAAETIVGQPSSAIYGDEQATRHVALDKLVFASGAALPPFEEEIAGLDGETHTFVVTKYPIRDESDRVDAVLTTALDVTAHKRNEAHLRQLASQDALTNLPNRILLHERMRAQITRARRGDHVFALHLLDLDAFKTINDLLGHSAGDRFIQTMATRLRSVIREEDTLARLGGDEFAIIQSDASSIEDAANFANRLLSIVAEPEQLDGYPAVTTASIGIALHPQDGADCEELLRNADLAMYRAKAEKGNRFRFFAAGMKTRLRQEALLDAQLRVALEREEFVLWYQPQVELRTGRIVGAEALLRWRQPGGQLASPGVFLARAEETGLIVQISEWVALEACRAARRWPRSHERGVPVSINLSPLQFGNGTAPLTIARALGESGLDPTLLEVEITETALIDQFESVAADLKKLRDIGVRASIDDFGVGYSSINYVKRLPVTRLKIDQTFIRDLPGQSPGHSKDLAILRAILTLGRSFGLEVLGEGVETQAQAARLTEEGCELAQGYFFARPMPEADFVALLARDRAFPLSA